MLKFIKITLCLIAALIVACSLFGWHLHTVYRGFVGSTNSGEPTYSQEVREGFGRQITQSLKDKGVKAAIVSRSGQDREDLPKGIIFTHSAFWILAEDGENYEVWNLYHGEDNRNISSLVTDSPAEFLRLTKEADAGILVPSQEMQDKLAAYLRSAHYGSMHQINYSLISNPFDARWQNCNEFMLDTLASIFWNTDVTSEIKTRLKGTLTPSEITVSPVTRLVGPMVDERLILADHDGDIFTTTRQTLGQFLDSQGALAEDYILQLTQ